MATGAAPDAEPRFQDALRLLHGVAVAKDPVAAFRIFAELAEWGHAGAQLQAGKCFEDGTGVKRCAKNAALAYQAAARAGSLEALCYLGNSCLKGLGVSPDPERAVNLFRAAAKRGSVQGLVLLASCYFRGTGVERDQTLAVRLFHRAMARGHSGAMFVVGGCYEKGIGGAPVDCVQALLLYWEASRRGYEPATRRLDEIRKQHRSNVGAEQNM